MKYALLGFGVSNRAVLDFLLKKGEDVFVSERGVLDERTKDYLESVGVEYEEGGNSERVLDSDVLVVSPGVKPSHPIVSKARERGLLVTTELDLAYEEIGRAGGKIIAVTGTNGKTTTTELIAHLLSKKFKVFKGGNTGVPLISAVGEIENYEIFTCEVSSFQLHWSAHFKPEIGVLLNVAPDHLDWHPSFEDYLESKLSMFERQGSNDVAFVSKSVESLLRSSHFKSRVIPFDRTSGYRVTVNGGVLELEGGVKHPLERLPVHMWEDFVAAVSVALYLGLKPEEIVEGLATFKLLSHRFEFVLEDNGVSFVDDSKATNAHAVVAALSGINERSVVLLLSGLGKNEDYGELAEVISKKCRAVIAFGEMKKHAKRFVRDVPLVLAEDMEDAVKRAIDIAQPGDIVLLSPAGASFDLYNNYVERGDDFKRCVEKSVMAAVTPERSSA